MRKLQMKKTQQVKKTLRIKHPEHKKHQPETIAKLEAHND